MSSSTGAGAGLAKKAKEKVSSSTTSASAHLKTFNKPVKALPTDIGSKESGPAQPLLPCYPRNPKITVPRYTKSFQSSWYTRHNWCCYSILEDKVYCFPCIFFGPHNSGHQEHLFTKDGFNKWHRAIGDKNRGMDGHACSTDHLKSFGLWESFVTNKVSIQERLDPLLPELIEKNRDYFRILVPFIRYFVVEELAYRSRDEHDDSANNQGNYMEFIKLALETNPTFDKLRGNIKKQCSINQDYTSKTIFNDFVEIMASQVRDKIGEDIKSCGMFYLIIDECKDNASHEQLSVCVCEVL